MQQQPGTISSKFNYFFFATAETKHVGGRKCVLFEVLEVAKKQWRVLDMGWKQNIHVVSAINAHVVIKGLLISVLRQLLITEGIY